MTNRNQMALDALDRLRKSAMGYNGLLRNGDAWELYKEVQAAMKDAQKVCELTAKCDALVKALQMIAGEIPCPDNLLSNAEIAALSLAAHRDT